MEQLASELLEAKKKLDNFKPRNEAAGIRQELDRLNLMYQKGRISDDYYDEQYDKLNTKLAEALSSENIIPIQAYQPIQNALRDNWKEIYADLDASHKKSFWKSIIKEIYVDEKSRKICGFRFLF